MSEVWQVFIQILNTKPSMLLLVFIAFYIPVLSSSTGLSWLQKEFGLEQWYLASLRYPEVFLTFSGFLLSCALG